MTKRELLSFRHIINYQIKKQDEMITPSPTIAANGRSILSALLVASEIKNLAIAENPATLIKIYKKEGGEDKFFIMINNTKPTI